MNSNAWHNIFNIAAAILSGLTFLLVKLGCVESVTGTLDCSQAPLDPAWVGVLAGVAGVLSVIKLIMNVFRDGFGGLWKSQPPVEK